MPTAVNLDMPTFDFSPLPTSAQVEEIATWLARANFKVVRPLLPRDCFATEPNSDKLITVAILDTETTGTDPATDKIIELGMVLVEVNRESGQAYRVLTTFNELEDPGMAISPESTHIHNITDEMVAGKRIDDDEVERLLEEVSLVVAHNASFDRPFVEKRFPIFSDKAWACSLRQVPWSDEGIGSAKLEFLAYRFGFHYTGHRASTDCHALLEVLQESLPISGTKAMQSLLVNSSEPEVQVAALGAAFESKDLLREREYRWNPGKKVWAKGIPQRYVNDEVAWLSAFVYGGRPFELEHELLTAMNRYSYRAGERQTVHYPNAGQIGGKHE